MNNRLILTVLMLFILCGSFVGAATIDFVSPSDGETLSENSVTIKVNLLDVSNLNKLNFTFNSVTTSMLLNSNFPNGHYSFGPSDGLVLYLPFEGGSLTDYSLIGNTITNYNTGNTSSKFGSGRSFTATQYIDCGSNSEIKLGSTGTISLWFKFNTGISGGSNPNQLHLMSGGPSYFYFSSSSSRLHYFFADGSKNVYTESNSWDTNWHNVIVTSNGTVGRMYIDGVLQNSDLDVTGVNIFSNSVNLRIGSSSTSFIGDIDEVRIYNRALTESEIKNIYQSSLQKLSSTNFVLEVNKTDLEEGEYSYSVSLNDDDGVSTTGLKTFEYLGPQKVSFVSPPTPANLATIPTNEVTIKANLVDLVNLNKINFTFNSVTTSMLITSSFPNGHYSFGPSDGLVLYLPFEGGSLTNLGSAGSTATNNGAIQTTGKLGDAYSFDGVDDYIQISDSASFSNTERTVSFWMKPFSYSCPDPSYCSNIVVGKDDVGSNREFAITLARDSGNISRASANVVQFYSGGYTFLCPSQTFEINQWYHFVYIANSSTLVAYVNGNKSGEKNYSDTLKDGTAPFTLGKRHPSTNPYPFNGIIDDFRVYNRSLSESEIKDLYNSQLQKINSTDYVLDVNKNELYSGKYTYSLSVSDENGTFEKLQTFNVIPYLSGAIKGTSLEEGLLSYYAFEEESGNVVSDSKGVNHGTINGATINQEGKVGKCYSYDGNDDYVYSIIGNLPYEYSFSTWIKTNTKNREVFAFADDIPTSTLYEKNLFVDGNGMVLFRGYDGTARIVNSNTIITDNDWHHVVVTIKDNNYIKIYIDGIYKNEVNIGTSYSSYTTGYFTLGIGSYFNKYYMGLIDEIGIWNRVLTEEEVVNLYNNGEGIPFEKEEIEINKIDFITPPTPDNLITIPTNSVSIKANLTNLINLNLINFTFNSVTTSMLLNSDFGVGKYSFGPSDGLVLYLPFENNSLKDLSTNNLNVILLSDLVNVALGKTATQSTNYPGDYAASKAFDGNVNTFQHTYNNPNEWLAVDLGGNYLITKIKLIKRSATNDRPYHYKIQYSSDNFVSDIHDLYTEVDNSVTKEWSTSVTARYFRVYCTASEPLNIAEFELYSNSFTYVSSGSFGQAAHFMGVNNYANITSNSLAVQSFTVSAWIKTSNLSTRIFTHHRATGGDSGYWLSPNYGALVSSDGVFTVNSPTNPTLNTWQHVVFTSNGSVMKFYLNGVETNSTSYIGTIQYTSTNYSNVGAFNSKSDFFNGTMDELRVYNRSLTESEIKDLYYSHLQKVSSSSYVLEVNKTDLLVGENHYFISASNSTDYFSTDLRNFIYNKSKIKSKITFLPPTPENYDETLPYITIKANIDHSPNLTSIDFNFDGDVFSYPIDVNMPFESYYFPSSIDSLPDLVLWLDSNDLNEQPGSPVYNWYDKSGQGNDASTSGNKAPKLYYDQESKNNFLWFDGVDDFMSIGNLHPSLTNVSIFIVHKKTTTSSSISWQRLFTTFHSSCGSDYLGNCIALSVELPVTYNLTISRSFKANKYLLSSMIGRFQPASHTFYEGDIYEVIVYNRTLSQKEINIINNYLNNKYLIGIDEKNSEVQIYKINSTDFIFEKNFSNLNLGEHSFFIELQDDSVDFYYPSSEIIKFNVTFISIDYGKTTLENGSYTFNDIPVSLFSNDNEGFDNATIYLYKEGILYEEFTGTLPLSHTFESLPAGNYTFNVTGFYSDGTKYYLGDREINISCFTPSNNVLYTLSSNMFICPKTYSNVKFYVNSPNVILDCNGAQFNGLGTSGAGYGLEVRESAQNLIIRDCKFNNYAYAAYIFGTSANNIANLQILNSSFTRSYYNNINAYYIKNSLFDNIIVANESYVSDSYHNIYIWYINNVEIKNSLIADNSGDGIYAQSGQILHVTNTTFLNNRYALYTYDINSNANSYSIIKDNYFEGKSNSIRSESSYRLYVYNNLFKTTSVYVRDNVATHKFNTTLDCSQKNIIDGPCIGGNFWYRNIIPDLNGDGFGDYAYNNTYLIDSLPLKQLLHFINPTYQDWVNSRDLLNQDFIPINLTSYYNENFTNVTLYLYKNGVLYDEVEVDLLPFSHTFTSLGTGNYVVSSIGYYDGELREGERRTFILGDCFTPVNNTSYTFIQNEDIQVCPGNYSYVRFYTNAPYVNINCNNANIVGLGSSNQGIQLGASASNVNITNCHFEAYAYGFYAYGTSHTDKIENIRIENSTFQNNWNNNLYLYYVKDSSFNNISAKGIKTTGSSDSIYSSMYAYYSDALNITNSEFTSDRGSGLYLYGYSGTPYSSNNLIENCTFNSNLYHGVYISIQDNLIFRSNEIKSNTQHGLYLSNIRNSLIENNNIRDNKYHGIYVQNSNTLSTSSSIIKNNFIINNGGFSASYYGLNSVSTYRLYIYNNYFQNSGNRNVFIQVNGDTHYFTTTKDCNTTNIMGGPCIGGNYWSNYESSINHIEDVDEDGFGDVSYTARPTNSQLVTDTLPLTGRLLYFVSPTPQSWVNYREYLKQDFIKVNISSYYNENFTNVTLNLYKENVLIDTIQTNSLSYYHEFTSLETGNYKITLTGTYNGELVNGEERIIILGDCYYPINNSYVTLVPGENFKMCPGNYTYVRLYTNSENVNIDCNGAKVIGTGSSNQGIELGASASNVNITNCHFEAYNYGFYAKGTSHSDKIENIRIENSTFQNNWNDNLYLYYVKDSSFNNISAKGINTTGSSDSAYSSMYVYYSDALNITNSEFRSDRGSGLYLYGYSGTPYSSNNLIENCTFNSNLYNGVYIQYQENLIFRSNEIKSNKQHGIRLYQIRNSLIENNDIRSNQYHGMFLQYLNQLASTSTTIRGNFLIGNGGSSSSQYGMRTEYSYRLYIYNNYFQNSGNRNIYVAQNGNTHYFNVEKDCSERNIVFGECIGGNYWNTYSGIDANADGIGDTVYTTQPSGSQLITDNLPLMKSYVVDSCGTITLTGEHYVLSNLNAGSTSPCIIINGNGITLNLYGNTITNSNSGPTILVNNSNNAIIHNGNIQSGTYNELGAIHSLNSHLHVLNVNFNNINCNNENCSAVYSTNSPLTLTNVKFNGITQPFYTENSVTYTNLTICNSTNNNCIKWLNGVSPNGLKPVLNNNILIGYNTVAVDSSNPNILGLNSNALITLSTNVCPVNYVKYNDFTQDLETILTEGEIYIPAQFTCGAGKTTFLTKNGFSSYGLGEVDKDFSIIGDLEINPLNPKEGDRVYISGIMNSTVSSAASVRVGLFVDNVEVNYTNVNIIDNGTTPISLSFVPLISKDYNVKLKVDSNSMYIELNESNNEKEENIFVLRSAKLNILYPSNNTLIVRGKNIPSEDTFSLVDDTSDFIAYVHSLNNSSVNATCHFYINGTLLGSSLTDNGTCYVTYDKTNSLLGMRDIHVNFTINEHSTTYSNNPFSSILQNLVIANSSIVPSNYREGLKYNKGDAVITNVLTYYNNLPTDVHNFKLFIGGSSSMPCVHNSLPNEEDAWFVLTKSNSVRVSEGNYKLNSVLKNEHNENIHWCLYVFDSSDETIISSSHQDMGIQNADSTLQFDIRDGNNLLNSNVLILDRNGNIIESSTVSSINIPVTIGDNHTISITNVKDKIKFNNFTIPSPFVSFKLNFITYTGVKPFSGEGLITRMLYLINETELDYLNAELYFQKNVDSRVVYKCNSYNTVTKECLDWEIHSPLNQNSNSTHIWFTANDFSGYMYGPEQTQLNVWDMGDLGMPFSQEEVKMNRPVYFYANFTDSNLNLLQGSTCTINFGSGNLNMPYNSGTGYYTYTRQFNTEGIYDYTITCNKNGYTKLSESGDISISDSPPPYITNIDITPTVAYKSTSITCTGTVYDDDDLNGLSLEFNFYNGSTKLYSTSYSNLNNGTTRSASMSPSYFSKGMNVVCKIRGSDGTSYSTYYESFKSVPVENSVPTWTNPTNVINADTSNEGFFTLSCTDLDGDSLTYTLNNNLSGKLYIENNKLKWYLWDETESGSYSLLFNCSDGSSNVSKTFTYNVIDTTKPTYFDMSNASTDVYVIGDSVTFNITFSDEHPNKVYFRFDSGSGSFLSYPFDWDEKVQTFTYTYKINNPNGVKRFYWEGIDSKNNKNSTEVIEITLIESSSMMNVWDSTTPGMPYGGKNVYVNRDTYFYANYTNLAGSSLGDSAVCNITFEDGSINSMLYDYSSRYYYSSKSFNAEGVYKYNISCSANAYTQLNKSGSVSISNSITPYVTYVKISPNVLYENSIVTCSATINDDDDLNGLSLDFEVKDGLNVLYSRTLTGLNNKTEYSISTPAGISFNKESNVYCSVRGYDGTSYSDWEVSPSVTVQNSAPVWSVTSNILANTSSLGSYTLECTDSDGDALTFTLNNNLDGKLYIEGNKLKWNYVWDESEVASYPILFTCSDGIETISKNMNYIIVDTTKPIYSNVENSSTEIYVEESITFSATFSDKHPYKVYLRHEVDSVLKSIETFEWISETQTFSKEYVVNTAPGKVNKFYWIGKDSYDNSINTPSIEFNLINRLPTFSGTIPDEQFNTGEIITIDLSEYFYDEDEPLTYSVNNVSSSKLKVNFNNNNLILTSNIPGMEWLEIKAKDSAGEYVISNRFNLIVLKTPQPPIVQNVMCNGMTPIGNLFEVLEYEPIIVIADVTNEGENLKCKLKWIGEEIDDIEGSITPDSKVTFVSPNDIPPRVYEIEIECWDTIGIRKIPNNMLKIIKLSPDILIDINDIEFNPNPASVEEDVYCNFKLNNIGLLDATNVKVDYFVDNFKKGEVVFPLVKSFDESVTKQFTFVLNSTGYHHVRFEIDPENELEEFNRDNNIITKLIIAGREDKVDMIRFDGISTNSSIVYTNKEFTLRAPVYYDLEDFPLVQGATTKITFNGIVYNGTSDSEGHFSDIKLEAPSTPGIYNVDIYVSDGNVEGNTSGTIKVVSPIPPITCTYPYDLPMLSAVHIKGPSPSGEYVEGGTYTFTVKVKNGNSCSPDSIVPGLAGFVPIKVTEGSNVIFYKERMEDMGIGSEATYTFDYTLTRPGIFSFTLSINDLIDGERKITEYNYNDNYYTYTFNVKPKLENNHTSDVDVCSGISLTPYFDFVEYPSNFFVSSAVTLTGQIKNPRTSSIDISSVRMNLYDENNNLVNFYYSPSSFTIGYKGSRTIATFPVSRDVGGYDYTLEIIVIDSEGCIHHSNYTKKLNFVQAVELGGNTLSNYPTRYSPKQERIEGDDFEAEVNIINYGNLALSKPINVSVKLYRILRDYVGNEYEVFEDEQKTLFNQGLGVLNDNHIKPITITYTDLPPGKFAFYAYFDSDTEVHEYYRGRNNGKFSNEIFIDQFIVYDKGPKFEIDINSVSRTVIYKPTSFNVRIENKGYSDAEEFSYNILFKHADGTSVSLHEGSSLVFASEYYETIPLSITSDKLGNAQIIVNYNYIFEGVSYSLSEVKNIIVGFPEIAIYSDYIMFTDDFVREGDEINITSYVWNLGPYKAFDVSSNLTINNTFIGMNYSDVIESGKYDIRTFKFTVPLSGDNLVQVTVNEENIPHELNQLDNVASKILLNVLDPSLNQPPSLEFIEGNSYISGTVPLTSVLTDPDSPTEVFTVDFDMISFDTLDEFELFSVKVAKEGDTTIKSGAKFGGDLHTTSYDDGMYIFSSNTTDDTGLEAQTTSNPYVIDNTPPVVNITSPNNNDLITTPSVDIIYSVEEVNPKETKWRYSNNNGATWSSFNTLSSVNYDGSDNVFTFDAGTYCPNLNNPDCLIEILSTDLAGNEGDTTVQFRTKSEDDPPRKSRFHVDLNFDCVPGNLELDVDSDDDKSVNGADIRITNSAKNIVINGEVTNKKFSANLEKEGTYSIRISKSNFYTFNTEFDAELCEIPIEKDELVLNVNFYCSKEMGNILSVHLSNSTHDITSDDSIHVFYADSKSPLSTIPTSSGYGYVSIDESGAGKYTFFVSHTGYDSFSKDYYVSELCVFGCVVDEDCPGDEICVDGECVPEDDDEDEKLGTIRISYPDEICQLSPFSIDLVGDEVCSSNMFVRIYNEESGYDFVNPDVTDSLILTIPTTPGEYVVSISKKGCKSLTEVINIIDCSDDLFEDVIDKPLHEQLFNTINEFLRTSIKSGCEGFYFEGVPTIFCDMVWVVVILGSIIGAYLEPNRSRKMLIFIAPTILAIIFLPIAGALGSGVGIYLGYTSKKRLKEQLLVEKAQMEEEISK